MDDTYMPKVVALDGGVIELPIIQNSPYTLCFGNFNVLVCDDGCVLLLSSSAIKTIKEMSPGQDRLINTWKMFKEPVPPMAEDIYTKLLDESLLWMPKEDVPDASS